MTNSIKVVSLNIEYCAAITKGYWQYFTSIWKYIAPHNINAIWHIADLINTERADICTFMEIDGGSIRTRHKNYLTILSNLTELKKNVFFPVRRIFMFSNQGNGLLTRYEILETKNIKLKTRGENRYLSITRLKIDKEHEITVFTTQLALGKMSRKKELGQIADEINKTSGPIIFTGDLNTHNERELGIFKETRLRRIETPQTFPSWAPKKRLDYIFYSPELDVAEYHVMEDMKVSDHLPLVAEFELKSIN